MEVVDALDLNHERPPSYGRLHTARRVCMVATLTLSLTQAWSTNAVRLTNLVHVVTGIERGDQLSRRVRIEDSHNPVKL